MGSFMDGSINNSIDDTQSMPSEVFGIPESLVLAVVDGEDERIVGLSPCTVRLCGDVERIDTLELVYYSFKDDSYIYLEINEFDLAGGLIFIKYRPFSDAVNFIIKQYYNFIQVKSNSIGNSFSNELVEYPDDTDYDISNKGMEAFYQAVKVKESYDIAKEYCKEKGIELCVSLDNSSSWRAFDFDRAASDGVRRIYIGNQFCPYMRPSFNEFTSFMRKAKEKDISVTLSLAFLPDTLIDSMNEFLTNVYDFLCSENLSIEVVVNDYGYLSLLKPYLDRMSVSFGILLNKRRKDPRYIYKNGAAGRNALLRQNQLDFDSFRVFLLEKGVTRFEFDLCGYESQINCEPSSLHLPLYQTNTGAYCTLRAACVFGDRGQQKADTVCSAFCRDYYFAYSGESKLIGLGNSLFGIQNIDYEVLQNNIGKAGRIVFNLPDR